MLAEILNYKSDGNKNQEARSPLVENEVLVSVRAWSVLYKSISLTPHQVKKE